MIVGRTALAAALWLALTADPAAARRAVQVAHPDCNVTMPCEGVTTSIRGEQLRKKLPIGEPQKVYKRKKAKRSVSVRVAAKPPVRVPLPATRPVQPPPTPAEFIVAVMVLLSRPFEAVQQPKPAPTIAGFIQRVLSLGRSVSLAGVVPRLADKARELQRECGSYVISAVRNTRIAGTRRISLHASGEAVDIAGNPDCMYANLRNWPGGVSTDYHRIRPAHIHLSLAERSRREMGARFAHGGQRKARRVQYASAN